MIRFRLVEDERRYLLLRSELYLRLSQAGISVPVLADVLRNLGKIESFAYSEGIRQGAVCGTIQDGNDDRTALDLHHEIYGSADTPLRAVEKEQWGHTETIGAFEEDPLEFAPLTLAEAKKHYKNHPTDGEVHRPPPVEQLEESTAPDRAEDDFDTLLGILHGAPSEAKDASGGHLFEAVSPEFLDRVRDELEIAKKSGKDFDRYEDLVFHLHLALGVDAGALDLQLSTFEGRTVLDQAGFFDYPPSEPFDMSMFMDKPPADLRGT